MIFVDSNVPMYLVGAPHPNKDEAIRLLERCVDQQQRLVTNAEVLQEILHRYAAINRRATIQFAFDALLGIVDEVLSIELRDVERAKSLLIGTSDLSARDALHVAVMQRHRVKHILTFDKGFDRVAGIERVK